MQRVLLLTILCLSFGIFIYARMPAGYSDYYARYKVLPMTYFYDLALFKNGSLNMTDFLKGCYNSSEYLGTVSMPCGLFKTDTTVNCTGSVTVIHDEEAILITFRGTVGDQEMNDEEYDYNLTVPFPGGGTVNKFYYNGFLAAWNAGIRDAYFAAKNKYPTYELWVAGTSMGGSLAGVAAPFISQMGYVDPSQLKLLTFGMLRIGKADLISRFPTLVPYVYRVTHRADMIPHLIPLTAGYQHFSPEIWYPNEMSIWDKYIQCDDIESLNCSDSINASGWQWNDHYYYNHQLCPPYQYIL